MANIDVTGMRSGRWTVLKLVAPYITPKGKAYRRVRCVCDCGTESDVALQAITGQTTKSCGCLRRETTTRIKTTHGRSKERGYSSYHQMVSRCYSENDKLYRWYGARGIKVAPEWLGPTGYVVFSDYIGPRPSPKHTVDRIDVNGNYEPGNVRWADRTTQARNRRDCLFVEIDGERVHFVEAAERLGVNINTARTRRNIYKMTPEEALGLVPHPLHRSPKRKRA